MGVVHGKAVGCNRLVTSIGELSVSNESRRGCYQFSVRRILDGSGW